jgi:hypothetical protein
VIGAFRQTVSGKRPATAACACATAVVERDDIAATSRHTTIGFSAITWPPNAHREFLRQSGGVPGVAHEDVRDHGFLPLRLVPMIPQSGRKGKSARPRRHA